MHWNWKLLYYIHCVLGQNSTSSWKTFTSTLREGFIIFSNCLFICHASEHWNSYWRVIRSKNGCDGGGQQRTCVIHTNLPSNGTDMIHIAGHARVFHPALQLKLHRHFLRSRGSCCCYCGHLRRQREATNFLREDKNAASSWHENMWKLNTSQSPMLFWTPNKSK